MKHYYKGKVEKGGFRLISRKAFDASIRHYKDGDYLVTLFRLRNKDQREWQQFYFAVLGAWSDDTGYTKAEIHDMVKGELFPDLFETETSTTQLTNEQWSILFSKFGKLPHIKIREPMRKARGFWNKEKCIKEARKYKTP